jgi:hypothetical protein
MKQSILLLLISFFLFACQKEVTSDVSSENGNNNNNNNNQSKYYIKCKINGEARSFNYLNQALITDFGSFKSLALIGSASATGGEGFNIGINFMSGGPAVTTYSEDANTTDYAIAGVYNPGSTTIVYGAGIVTPSPLPLSVTVTSMQAGEMSGTFKGTFYKQNITSGEISSTDFKTITDGEFKLPIK